MQTEEGVSDVAARPRLHIPSNKVRRSVGPAEFADDYVLSWVGRSLASIRERAITSARWLGGHFYKNRAGRSEGRGRTRLKN